METRQEGTKNKVIQEAEGKNNEVGTGYKKVTILNKVTILTGYTLMALSIAKKSNRACLITNKQK